MNNDIRRCGMKRAFEIVGILISSLFFMSIPILCTLSVVYDWFGSIQLILYCACFVEWVGFINLLVHVADKHY